MQQPHVHSVATNYGRIDDWGKSSVYIVYGFAVSCLVVSIICFFPAVVCSLPAAIYANKVSLTVTMLVNYLLITFKLYILNHLICMHVIIQYCMCIVRKDYELRCTCSHGPYNNFDKKNFNGEEIYNITLHSMH